MNTDVPNGITPLPNGQWTIEHDTHLSKWAREVGDIVTDPHVFIFLRPHLQNVEVVWDIGANIGDHTRHYLDLGKQVVAVEPNPLAYLCLIHNCPKATPINAAASDSDTGPLKFKRLENVGASRIHPDGDIEVYPVVLDRENLPAPDFIKIDVEGWEVQAIKGMAGTIAKHHPMIFCEINRGALEGNGFTPEDLIEFVEAMGYTSNLVYPTSASRKDPQYDILFLPEA